MSEPAENYPLEPTISGVIDKIVKETQFQAYVLLFLSVLIVFTGLGILIYGVFSGNPYVSGSGAITTGMFWPAFHYANNMKIHHATIRAMELLDKRVPTTSELIKIMQTIAGMAEKGKSK